MAAGASELGLLPRLGPGPCREVQRKVNTRHAQTTRLRQGSLLDSDRCLCFSQRFSGRRRAVSEPGEFPGARGCFPARSEAPGAGDKEEAGAVRAAPRARGLRPPVDCGCKSLETYCNETRLLLKWEAS